MDSPVIEAIVLGDHADLVAALNAGNSADVFDGTTSALSLACLQDRNDLVDALLRSKASVDIRDGDGATPIFTAASIGSQAIVEQLLKAGAAPNVRNEIGQSPLMVAAHSGSVQCVHVLIAYNAEPLLLDERSRNALHWAMVGGDWPDVARLLLGAGLSVASKTADGESVLDYAMKLSRSSSLALLQKS